VQRVTRMELGNFGDRKLCRDSVGELRIDVAVRYRVYYAVADKAHLIAPQLYRTLSPDGNPVLSSLSAILKAMGLRLAVQAVQTPPHTLNNAPMTTRHHRQDKPGVDLRS
jgi:DNA-binding phage protein